MAVAQSKSGTAAAVAGGTGISITFNSTPTAGNVLVVAVSAFEGAGSGVLNNPTDNKGNTYTPIGTAQSANGTQWEMQLFYSENCATGATHTVTATGTATTYDFTICIVELSGRATTGAFDATNQAGPTNSNAPNSGSITPVANADSIGICAVDEFAASEPVKGASWTLVQLVDGTSSVVLAVESAVSFTGAANWTMGAFHFWVAKVVLFALAGVAAGGSGPSTTRRPRVHPARDMVHGRPGKRGPFRSFYRHFRTISGLVADFDGTAFPGVIDVALTVPAATTQAGSVVTPAAIVAGPVAIPAVTTQAGAVATPAALVAGPVVLPAVTKVAGSTVSPAAIVAGPVVIPQAVAGTGSVVSPASITLTLTMPAVTTAAGSTALPAVIPLAVTIPQASATGGGAATALPAAITLAVTIPQAVTQGGAVVSPAVIPLSVTIPQAVTKGGATVSPAVIPLAVTIPQATATGASPGTATPASITTQVTIPQVTPLAGTTVAPGAVTLNVTMPAALPQASKTATPAVIPLTVTMPAATANGSTASTATPNAIALVTVLPAPTLRFGYVVNPNVIALAISIGAAIASGLAPDAHPITLTLRDAGHTVTVRVVGTTATVRDSGHTATVRENR